MNFFLSSLRLYAIGVSCQKNKSSRTSRFLKVGTNVRRVLHIFLFNVISKRLFFFVICYFFFSLQQHNTVLRIHYLQSLNLQKALQYLQYITYSNLLTIHVTVYLQYITYNSLITVHVTKKLNTKQIVVN